MKDTQDSLYAAFWYQGAVHPHILRAALRATVARHGSLGMNPAETPASTGFCDDGHDLLEVVDRPDPGLGFISSWAHGAVTPARPLRAMLLETGGDNGAVVLAVHSSVADRQSLTLLLDDIAYSYREGGAAAATSDAPFSVFTQRQYAAQQRGDFDEEIARMRSVLERAPQPASFPADHPHETVQEPGRPSAATIAHTLTVSRMEQWAACFPDQAGGEVISTSAAVAVLTVLLQRYSGLDRVLLGTEMTKRPEGFEDSVGGFAGVTVLDLPINASGPFTELVETVRQALSEQPGNADFPYDAVYGVPLGEATPPYRVALTVRGRLESLDLGEGVTTRRAAVARTQATAQLSLALYQAADGAALLEATYDSQLFEQDTIRRILAQYERVMMEVAADPAQEVSRIIVLPDAERKAILGIFNDTEIAYPESTVIDYFEAQARATPDAVAVQFGPHSLTYSELDLQGNQAARAILSLHDPASDFVGIFMERSIDMVVALVSIMKAGLAYVPIDPDYPKERIRYMIEDSGISIVLTQEGLNRQLADTAVHRTTVPTLLAQSPDSGPITRTLGPESRIYMIYTSGSTGRPKGVINRHGSLFNKMYWMQQRFGLTSEDRLLQKTPYSFDVSFWEFFWPLMFGARLVVADPGGHRDPGYLRTAVRDYQITVIHFVPSMLSLFLEESAPALRRDCKSVRLVFASGEALPYDTIQSFFQIFDCELHNLYGPTEAAIEVAHWACTLNGPDSTVPIGKPVANTVLYVVDEHLELQPIGAPGELCIGGVQLAEGYNNLNEANRSAFVPSPYPHPKESRIYRTGDVARYRPSGEIEFLGRVDSQIKLRGVRIELEELEAALRGLPSVREAAAGLHGSTSDGVLVAYVVAREFDSQRAKEALSARLPATMVPHIFIQLHELPMTPSGKLDRRALPAPTGEDRSDHPPATARDTVSTVTEAGAGLTSKETLTETFRMLFAEALAQPQVGENEDFFDLGGHSLSAIRLAGRITVATGREIDPWSLFEEPTPAGLARLVVDGDEPLGGGNA